MSINSKGALTTTNGQNPDRTLQAGGLANTIMSDKTAGGKPFTVVIDSILGRIPSPDTRKGDYAKGGQYEHFGYALNHCQGSSPESVIETIKNLRNRYEKKDKSKSDDLSSLLERLQQENGQALPATLPLPAEFGGPEPEIEVYSATQVYGFLGKTVYPWRPYLMEGGLTAIAGDVGAGKTEFAMDLHRRQWKGLEWPDGQKIEGGGKPIVYLMADQRASQVCELAARYGVDSDNVFFVTEAGNPVQPLYLDNPASIDRLAAIVRKIKPWAVVVDTFTSAMGSLEHTRPEVINGVTDRLLGIAIENQVPIILLCHTNSSGEIYGKALSRKAEHQLSIVLSDKANPKTCGRNLHPKRSRYINECSSLGVVWSSDGLEFTEPYPEIDLKNGSVNQTLKDKVSEEALKMAALVESEGFTQISLVYALLGEDRDEDKIKNMRNRVSRAVRSLVSSGDLQEVSGRYYLSSVQAPE